MPFHFRPFDQSLSICLLRSPPAFVRFDQCAHYGSPRFKPVQAKVKPQRTATMLALDNFDFYYGPMFGTQWPSIRLGLLTRKKFVAVLNRYAANFESNREIMKSLGTINLMEQMAIGEKGIPEHIIKMKEDMDQKAEKARQSMLDADNEEEGDTEKPLISEDFGAEDDIESRLEMGMNQFQPATNVIDQEEQKKRKKRRKWEEKEGKEEGEHSAKRMIYDSKFKITGLEGTDELLPAVEDVVIYPRDLHVYSYPRMRIDGFPEPLRDQNHINGWWLLDGGSVLPVLALDLQEDDLVLDMCASPGGKSLLIAQTGKFASLVCNDFSIGRLGKLRNGLALHIPAGSDVSSRILLKRKDAASVEAWTDVDMFDKVLVDVPCNTDRRAVTTDAGNLFSHQNTTERLNLPQEQTKMLVNALRALRMGGSAVYSTCTLSPTQNEMVVENACALARTHYGIEAVERTQRKMVNKLIRTELFQFWAQCRRGFLLVPSLLSNFGPTYVCKLQRIK